MDPGENLVDHFGVAASAQAARDLVELATHALQNSPSVFDIFFRAGREDGQRAVGCAACASGNGAIDQSKIGSPDLLQPGLEFVDISRRNGGTHDDDSIFFQALYGTRLGVEKEWRRLDGSGDHADEHIGVLDGFFGGFGGGGGFTFFEESIQCWLIDVEAGDCVAGLDEVGCHAVAHGAESGEGDFGWLGRHSGRSRVRL